jgi:hypothetical protein
VPGRALSPRAHESAPVPVAVVEPGNSANVVPLIVFNREVAAIGIYPEFAQAKP